MSVNFRDYFLSLSKTEQEIFAENAETTVLYIRTHLITGYKVPRRKLMNNLVKASNGVMDIPSLAKFFHEKSPATHVS